MFHNLPIQHHTQGTKCSNAQIYGETFQAPLGGKAVTQRKIAGVAANGQLTGHHQEKKPEL